MDQIIALCRKHKVGFLFASGSVAKCTIGPQTDLVVDIAIVDLFDENLFNRLSG